MATHTTIRINGFGVFILLVLSFGLVTAFGWAGLFCALLINLVTFGLLGNQTCFRVALVGIPVLLAILFFVVA